MRGFYKHDKSMDLVLEVLKTSYRDAKRLKVVARLWNLGYTGKPWPMGLKQKFEIKTSDLNNWKPIQSLIKEI